MPKWIGNRIGVGVTFVGDEEASSAFIIYLISIMENVLVGGRRHHYQD